MTQVVFPRNIFHVETPIAFSVAFDAGTSNIARGASSLAVVCPLVSSCGAEQPIASVSSDPRRRTFVLREPIAPPNTSTMGHCTVRTARNDGQNLCGLMWA